VILLNKTDLASDSEQQAIRSRVRVLNPLARLVLTRNCAVDLDVILNIRAFDLTRLLELDPLYLMADSDKPKHEHTDGEHCDVCDGHSSDEEHDGKKSAAAPAAAAAAASSSSPIVSPQKTVRHFGVKAFCLQHRGGELNGELLDQWLSQVIREHGPRLYRMKGILAIRNLPNRLSIHAIHHNIQAAPLKPWADGEERISKLVFIGRELPQQQFEEAFLKCMST